MESRDSEKLELCKKIKNYGFSVITALNAKYDFISVIAKEIIFDYVEKNLKGEKLEYEPDIEELEKFLDTIEQYLALDNNAWIYKKYLMSVNYY